MKRKLLLSAAAIVTLLPTVGQAQSSVQPYQGKIGRTVAESQLASALVV